MHRRNVLLLSALAALACGGRVIGSASEAGTDGAGDLDGSSDSASPTDSNVPSGEAAVTCTPGPGGGTTGANGSCTVSLSETCSNGTTYMAECACPGTQCTCSSMTSTGGGTGGVGIDYQGCPSCSTEAAWIACDFPPH